MKEFCRICGDTEIYLQAKGMQVGVYCANCGKWIKWLSKKDQSIYKNSGYKIYSQDAQIQLKGAVIKGLTTQSMGVNLGLEDDGELQNNVNTPEDKQMVILNSPTSFGVNPTQMPMLSKPGANKVTEDMIEKEVERRVQKRLKALNKGKGNESVDEDSYCSFCDGSPLPSDRINNVEVSIFSGTLSVTNKEGTQILGLYKLKRCPNCGRFF